MDLNLHKFTKGIKLIIGTVEKGIYYKRKKNKLEIGRGNKL